LRYCGVIEPFRGAPYVPGYSYLNEVRELNYWLRITLALLGSLMLLAVAASAATSISGERDRDTLDALLTSPLQSHDIIFGKWLGSVLSVRWVWLWLGMFWIIGITTKALHPVTLGLFMIAWLVYASFFAGLGLWFSTTCRTSLRATLWTLATTIFVGGGHLALGMCCLPVGLGPGPGSLPTELLGIQAIFVPTWTFYLICASAESLNSQEGVTVQVIVAYFALFVWALGALFLWTVTRSVFRRITARMPYHRPEFPKLMHR